MRRKLNYLRHLAPRLRAQQLAPAGLLPRRSRLEKFAIFLAHNHPCAAAPFAFLFTHTRIRPALYV